MSVLNALVSYYRRPMISYVLGYGIQRADAEDLVHRFLIRSGYLVDVVRQYQGKGGAVRLAAIVCKSLRLFVIDHHFRQLRQRQENSLDADHAAVATWHDRAEACFARECLQRALEEAAAVVRVRYERKPRPLLFDELLPYIARQREEAGTQRALAPILGMAEGGVNAFIFRWRKRLSEAVRERIAQTQPNPDGVDAELRELRHLCTEAEHFTAAVVTPDTSS